MKIKDKAMEILSKMSLKEKIGQLTQVNFSGNNIENVAEKIEKYGIGSIILSNSQFAGFVEQESVKVDVMTYFQKTAVEKNRNGIPILIGRDVIHGHNIVFPVNLAMAASFDPELIRNAYICIREEAANDGINWTFSPMLDFCHDPRWGRIIECQGEDPFLASQMAEAIVKGFQGEDLPQNGALAACAKHYIGYGASEGGRDYSHTEISDYSLQNNYLPAFRSAINAGVATVMNSFNEMNVIPVASSRRLLTDVLRGQLGFEGFVISDWGSIAQLKNHSVAENDKEAAYLALKAGIDMDMVDDCYFDFLEELVEEGRIKEEEIDVAVLRILETKLKMGLFENPYHMQKEIDYESHAKLAEKVCENCFVLLKNKNSILPLSKDTNVCITGPFAELTDEHVGSWSLERGAIKILSLKDEITRIINDSSKIKYVSNLNSQYVLPRNTDVIICALGEPRCVTGEGRSLASIELPEQQIDLLKHLKKLGKPIIGVMNYGRPVALENVEPYLDAILYTWHSGSMSTKAVANVLFGESEPSGRLPVTLPRCTGQIPIYYNMLPGARDINGYYGEENHDIFNYEDCDGTPMYPFGYGLSYTDFDYSSIKLSKNTISLEELQAGEKITVGVDVRNIGKCNGIETVQLYVRDKIASYTRPLKELKAFKKMNISKNESILFEFELGYKELGFYLENGDFIVEKGEFDIYIGDNCLTENKVSVLVL